MCPPDPNAFGVVAPQQYKKEFQMSMQLSKVLVPSPIAMQRGAEWVSELITRLGLIGQSVWASLVVIGQARAQHELDQLATRYAHNPEFAQALHDAATLSGNRSRQ
jgi:hypothetical protein